MLGFEPCPVEDELTSLFLSLEAGLAGNGQHVMEKSGLFISILISFFFIEFVLCKLM